MKASNPLAALKLIAGDAIELAEQTYDTEPSIESSRLVTAARVFEGVVDLFIEYQKQERK